MARFRFFSVIMLASFAVGGCKSTTELSGGSKPNGIDTLNAIFVFAGTRPANVFRSSDSGASWVAGSGIGGHYVSNVAVSGKKLFAATDSAGLFESDDNGVTWLSVLAFAALKKLDAIAAFGDTILFSAENSSGLGSDVYYSSTGGATWTHSNQLIGGGQPIRAFTKSGQVLLAGGTSLWRSTDGFNWEEYYSNGDVFCFAHLGQNLFATAYGMSGVIRSTDDGLTWSSPTSRGISIWIRSIAVCGSVVYAGSEGQSDVPRIFRSTDTGQTWNSVTDLNANVLSLASFGHYVIAATDGAGVMRSTDGGMSWSFPSTATIDSSVFSLTIK